MDKDNFIDFEQYYEENINQENEKLDTKTVKEILDDTRNLLNSIKWKEVQ